MTPAEKAVNAVNGRIERLQAILARADSETARRFLFESVLATVGVGEALTDYIKTVGKYARQRHGQLKETNAALEAQHADALKSGKELLEHLKANPADSAIRKQIELAQKNMAAVQKTLRRGTNALQRDVAPGVAMIDKLAVSIRRLSEAENSEALKRVLKTVMEHVRELYVAQRTLPLSGTVDAAAWEKTATVEIDQATDLYDAYARAGYQAILALEMMTMTLTETPPRTLAEATQRANESVVARIKGITARLTGPSGK